MNSAKWMSIGVIGLTLVAAGCAGTPRETYDQDAAQTTSPTKGGVGVTNAVAQEANAKNYVEIEYQKGSSVLSESAKSSLRGVVDMARRNGSIDEMIVLSWSDYKYPSENSKKLPKPQIALAEKRNSVVEDYLKSLRDVSVEKYNMAERPSSMSRWFNTSDARLKQSLVDAGLATSTDSDSMPSKISHSVILVKNE